jgi:hypothetical protein
LKPAEFRFTSILKLQDGKGEQGYNQNGNLTDNKDLDSRWQEVRKVALEQRKQAGQWQHDQNDDGKDRIFGTAQG